MNAGKAGVAFLCLAIGAATGFVLRPVGTDPDLYAGLHAELDGARAALAEAERARDESRPRARTAE